jgi:hypothetical protein
VLDGHRRHEVTYHHAGAERLTAVEAEGQEVVKQGVEGRVGAHGWSSVE